MHFPMKHRFRPLLLVLLLGPLLSACGPSSPDELLATAQEYRRNGDLDKAVVTLKAILQTSPNHAASRMALATAHLELGDGPSAEKELQRAVDLGVDAPSIRPELARAYVLQGKHDAVLQFNPGEDLPASANVELVVARGHAFLAQGELEMAKREFDAGVEIDPESTTALLGLALVARASGDVGTARDLAEKALTLEPRFADAAALLGDLAWEAGDLESAESHYSGAIENVVGKGPGFLIRRALLRVAAEDYAGAERDLASIRDVLGDVPEVLYVQAVLSFNQRRFGEAKDFAEQVLAKEPDYLRARYIGGVGHLTLGNLETASNYLGTFVARVPEFTPAKVLLAATKLRMGEFGEAATLVAPIIEAEPHNVLATRIYADALLEKADSIDLAIDRSDKATSAMLLTTGNTEYELEKIPVIGPNRGDEQFGGAATRPDDGKIEALMQMALGLVDKQPDIANSHALLGSVYSLKRNAAKATESFARALAIEPGNLAANSGMAALAVMSGQKDEARRYYQAIVSEHPHAVISALNLAALEGAAGNESEVRAIVEKVQSNNPDNPEPARWLAERYIKRGEGAKAVDLLELWPQLRNKHRSVAILYARSLLLTSNNKQALSVLSKLRQEDSQNLWVEYLFTKARQASGDSNGVMEAYEQISARSPEWSPPRYDIARLALQNELPEVARKQLVALGKLGDESADIHRLNAELAAFDGDRAKLQSSLERLFQVQPNNINLIAYTNAKWGAGKREEAVQHLEQWVDQHPNDGLIWGELGRRRLALGMNDDAIGAFRQALGKEGVDRGPILNNIAWLLLKKDPAQALAHVEEAIFLLPNSVDFQDTYALALLENGKVDDAYVVIQKITGEGTNRPELLYHKAIILNGRGMKAEAIELLEMLTKKEWAFPEKLDAERLLLELKG